jgi:hypothetical protein
MTALYFADPKLVAHFTKSQRKLITDAIPTGAHRARAEAWRRLAARCARAAEKHDAVADLREQTREYLHRFAPAVREAALVQLRLKGRDVDTTDTSFGPSRSESIAEAIVADAAPAPKPPVVSLFVHDQATIECEREDVTGYVDALHEGWIRRERQKLQAARDRRPDGFAVDQASELAAEWSKTQLGFTDALGYVHTVEIDVDREPGNEDEH